MQLAQAVPETPLSLRFVLTGAVSIWLPPSVSQMAVELPLYGVARLYLYSDIRVGLVMGKYVYYSLPAGFWVGCQRRINGSKILNILVIVYFSPPVYGRPASGFPARSVMLALAGTSRRSVPLPVPVATVTV